MKEESHKRPHIIWFCLYEIPGYNKCIDRLYVNSSQGLAVGARIDRKVENSVGGNRNALRLDCGDGCTTQ